MNWNQMTIAPVFPLWVILILLSLGLALTLIQYRVIRKRLGHPKAILICLLRFITLSVLISFSLNPSLTVRKERKIIPALAILVDRSQSMSFSGQGGKGTRLDEAEAFLLEGEKPLLKSLKESFEVTLYTMGELVQTIGEGELPGLKPAGRRGNLNDALEKLGPMNSLLLLLSDGNFQWNGSDKKGPPLIAVPLGDPKSYRDILIKEVRAPNMAFRDRPVQIDVVIKSDGYSGSTVPVVLRDGTKLLKAKSITLRKNSEEVVTSFSFTPEQVGSYPLSISIPPQFGESITSNNRANIALKVYRDKIRILMVSGSPSLNYRYMRIALKNDPTIDLLSFVILRTPTNMINVPLQEQSLIPFPVETLFTKELKNFDLVIFDNFFFPPYLNPNHLEGLKKFIKGGGGFAVIGGPNFFGEGGYIGTPIEEILPVRFSATEGYRRDLPSGVKLSRLGTIHPVTRFSSDENSLQSLWQEMPRLDGINLLEPKSSGSVLLESADGTPKPILTVGSYGKGRVLVLGTDYSWKWYMGMLAQRKGNWAYLRFMERMVRWLTRDPSLDPIQITLPQKGGEIGQEIGVKIQIKEEDSSSGSKGVISFSVFNPEGIKGVSQLKAMGHQGEYLGSFLPEKGGIYKVRVETLEGPLEESVVVAEGIEGLDGVPNHDHLKMIAGTTGGKVLSSGKDLLKEVEIYAEKSKEHFVEERRFPLWGTPYLLVLILTFLGTEWYVRRRGGMV
ncbi:MAG: hypothetical protein A2156_04070 [Deltaproteobacteria bacterium RBG_16_48_10]|nr:MAG: hypothetical protein A2156_04070 [Deltaproteobacteria bacterium RBG_16_48_10]